MRVLFFPKEGYVYCRITIDGKRREFSVEALNGLKIKKGSVVGRGERASALREHLSAIRVELSVLNRDFLRKGKTPTAPKIKNAYLQKEGDFKPVKLLNVLEEHIKIITKRVKFKKCTRKTLTKRKKIQEYLENFMKSENWSDIVVEEVDSHDHCLSLE